MLNIVLVEPEIPQNTGNIARTCAATNSRLHLIKPLGFVLDDKKLKRAGLDYWNMLSVRVYENLEEFFQINSGKRFVFSTTKAQYTYCDFSFRDGDFILFGKETAGLPESLLEKNLESCVRIPMIDGARSLNLSNSVAVLAYEALRQRGFEGLKKESIFFGTDH